YVCALISIACGAGLLWKRTSGTAARVLLGYLLLWSLVFRVPDVFRAPISLGAWYGCAESAVMVAGAWVLYTWFAPERDRQRFGFALDHGVRIARVLYGLALMPFGGAHFVHLQRPAQMVPGWLPAHLFWAYFTGCAFLAAGAGVLFGVFARLAAALSALQIGLFTVLVWTPMIRAGSMDAFEKIEFVTSIALTAGAWVVAESYRDASWLAVARGPSRREIAAK